MWLVYLSLLPNNMVSGSSLPCMTSQVNVFYINPGFTKTLMWICYIHGNWNKHFKGGASTVTIGLTTSVDLLASLTQVLQNKKIIEVLGWFHLNQWFSTFYLWPSFYFTQTLTYSIRFKNNHFYNIRNCFKMLKYFALYRKNINNWIYILIILWTLVENHWSKPFKVVPKIASAMA